MIFYADGIADPVAHHGAHKGPGDTRKDRDTGGFDQGRHGQQQNRAGDQGRNADKGFTEGNGRRNEGCPSRNLDSQQRLSQLR